MSLEKLIHELSGGRARLVSGKDADELLNNLKTAMNEEQAKDCPDPENCPVHGSRETSEPDITNLSEEEMLQLSIDAAAGAQRALAAGQVKMGKRIQEQSFLWLQIRDASGVSEQLKNARRELELAYDSMQSAHKRANRFEERAALEADRARMLQLDLDKLRQEQADKAAEVPMAEAQE